MSNIFRKLRALNKKNPGGGSRQTAERTSIGKALYDGKVKLSEVL